MDLLTLFNASGYLPLPPLDALLVNTTQGYSFKYLNWTDAVALNSFFSNYGLSVQRQRLSAPPAAQRPAGQHNQRLLVQVPQLERRGRLE